MSFSPSSILLPCTSSFGCCRELPNIAACNPAEISNVAEFRLRRQDHWHEFIFPSDVTLFECKARALQHFGILERLETSWQQRPGTPDSKGRILNSSTTGYASSSRHRRRTSLIPTGTLTGDGSQDSLGIADLAKAAEVLASYSLSNVCGGYTHDDQKKIGLACVDFDLLVVSIRFCAIHRWR